MIFREKPGPTLGNAMVRGKRNAIESERCRTSVGEWWQLCSGLRPDQSWYWDYWFERDYSPDLAFRIARLAQSCLRWLIGVVRWSLTVAEIGDAGEAIPTQVGRQWPLMRSSILRDLGGVGVILFSFSSRRSARRARASTTVKLLPTGGGYRPGKDHIVGETELSL
jgi:hypothetical protein